MIIVAALLIAVILTIAIIFSTGEKPPYEQIPYSFDDFQGYPSNITLERPMNNTDIWENISSIETNDKAKIAVKVILYNYEARDYKDEIGMRVFVLGSFNGSNGVFSESIKQMEIRFESNDNTATAELLETEMRMYNLEKHEFHRSPNEYVHESQGLSYWWTEGVGYNDVYMETSLKWYFIDDHEQDHTLNIRVRLAIGNLFGTHELGTSVYIDLII